MMKGINSLFWHPFLGYRYHQTTAVMPTTPHRCYSYQGACPPDPAYPLLPAPFSANARFPHHSLVWTMSYHLLSVTVQQEVPIDSGLTLMLLVANLANRKSCNKPEEWLKPWLIDTNLIVLSESFPMNTNMTGFQWFSKIFACKLI